MRWLKRTYHRLWWRVILRSIATGLCLIAAKICLNDNVMSAYVLLLCIGVWNLSYALLEARIQIKKIL